MIEKLLKMKKAGKLDDMEKSAKMGVLSSLRDLASEAMGGKLKSGLKKVTVASDSEEGLKHGLDKAKEVIDQAPADVEHDENMISKHLDDMSADHKDKMEEGSEEEEGLESPEEESIEDASGEGDMSEEEIDAKLAKLMELKKKKSHKI